MENRVYRKSTRYIISASLLRGSSSVTNMVRVAHWIPPSLPFLLCFLRNPFSDPSNFLSCCPSATLKKMLDPEAAARSRIKRRVKKTAGRKRKMEDMKRLRSARTFQVLSDTQ